MINTRNAAPDELCEAVDAATGGCIDTDALNFFLGGGSDLSGICFSPDGDTTGAICPLNAFPGLSSGFGPDAAGPDGLRPVPGRDLFGFIDPDGDGNKTSKDFAFDDIDEVETFGVTVKLTWDFSDFTMVSITDYKHFDKFVALDVDAAPINQLTASWIGYACWPASISSTSITRRSTDWPRRPPRPSQYPSVPKVCSRRTWKRFHTPDPVNWSTT